MKLGILGGTFNPVHIGHLALAQECWHALALEKVIFVPAYLPPHKDVENDVSPADRLNMLRLALEEDDRFEISTHELDAGGTSYSIDTIKSFRKKYGEDAELFFLTGADSAESLSEWKDVDEVLRLATFVIATRPGWKAESPYGERVRHIDIPDVEVSSTMIRDRVRRREPVDYYVPAPVVRYIRNKGLYRE